MLLRFYQRFPYKFLLCAPTGAFGIGYFLNSLVMWANKNSMPAYFPGYGCPVDPPRFLIDHVHSCMTTATHLKFLADIWILPGVIASLGDFFIFFWEFSFWPLLFLWMALVTKRAMDSGQ